MIRAWPTHRTTSTMRYVPLVRDEALTIHARLWHDIPRLQLLRWLLHTFYGGDRGKGGSCEVRWPARSRGREIGFCVSFYGFGLYPSHGLQPRFSKVHSGIQKQVWEDPKFEQTPHRARTRRSRTARAMLRHGHPLCLFFHGPTVPGRGVLPIVSLTNGNTAEFEYITQNEPEVLHR